MNNYSFIRTVAAAIQTRVANPSYNVGTAIKNAVANAFVNKASLVVFPELSVSGYSCGDLFNQSFLLKKCEEEIARLAEFSKDKELAIIVGAPVSFNCKIYNCAVIIYEGEVRGIVPKIYVPSSQSRWFASGIDLLHSPHMTYAGSECTITPNTLFLLGDAKVAIQIGDDLLAPIPQASHHALAGAQIIATLAAGNETTKDQIYLDQLLSTLTKQTISANIYSSS